MNLALHLGTLVCALLAVLLVRRYDLHDREPWPLLLGTLILAGGVMAGLGWVEDWTLDLVAGPGPTRLMLATVAATHEELARLLVVLAVAWLLPRFFNDPMDGLVYGSMAGLGMAISESLTHWDRAQATGLVGLLGHELTRIYMHTLLGGIVAFGLGPVRLGVPGGPAWLAVCGPLAIALHLAWDWLALGPVFGDPHASEQTLVALGLMLATTFLFGILAVRGSEWSRDHFDPTSPRRLLRWPIEIFRSRERRGPPAP